MHIRTVIVTAAIGLAAATAPTLAAASRHVAPASGNPANTAATGKSGPIGREQARTDAKRRHEMREARDAGDRHDDRPDAGEEREDD